MLILQFQSLTQAGKAQMRLNQAGIRCVMEKGTVASGCVYRLRLEEEDRERGLVAVRAAHIPFTLL